MENKDRLISLYEEVIQHLQEELHNVKTDTGRTVISDALDTYQNHLEYVKTAKKLNKTFPRIKDKTESK
ncbi:hypothetical protein MZM54_05225 [[Brevibacterium] frigoritolerans]|nr:hypothetical protein [Peribacillus frigoritolerans]